jgi:hypothetical protein
MQNLVVYFVYTTCVIKRWYSIGQLYSKYAKRPDIHRQIVCFLALDYFGTQPKSTPNHTPPTQTSLRQLRSQAKINQFHFSLHIPQYIIRFDIPMDYLVLVEVTQRQEHLVENIFDGGFGQRTLLGLGEGCYWGVHFFEDDEGAGFEVEGFDTVDYLGGFVLIHDADFGFEVVFLLFGESLFFVFDHLHGQDFSIFDPRHFVNSG